MKKVTLRLALIILLLAHEKGRATVSDTPLEYSNGIHFCGGFLQSSGNGESMSEDNEDPETTNPLDCTRLETVQGFTICNSIFIYFLHLDFYCFIIYIIYSRD
jgi:hypothetical protein